MSKTLLDTAYTVETPEGIDLQADLAGPVVRILAFAVDLSIRAVLLFFLFLIVSYAFSSVAQVARGILLIIYFLFEWFYPVIFEVLSRGQTPGKRLMKIAVVNEDLTPVTWGSSIVRNLLRVADFLPLFYLGGLLSMSLSHRFQRFGDLAAGTLVVYQREVMTPVSLPDVSPRAPTEMLSPEDEGAIIGFTQRHADLSADRKKELANILAQKIGYHDEDAVIYLQGVGIWLMGGR